MKHNKLFVLLFSAALIISCASVKQSDNWKSTNFKPVLTKKILVVSKAKDKEVSKSYEEEIVDMLKTKGIDAVARHVKYPALNDSEQLSKDEINDLVQQFKDDGIQAVLVSRLKDVKTKTKLITEGGYAPAYRDKKGKIVFSFYDYYINDMNRAPSLEAKEMPETTKVLKSKTYFLEAVTYDLSLPDKDKVVSIIQADVSDPNYASDVRKGFSKIIAKQF